MSFLSGVLVGTTTVSTTDQLSSVWTSAFASATCHSALGRDSSLVRAASSRFRGRLGWGLSVAPGVPALKLPGMSSSPQSPTSPEVRPSESPRISSASQKPRPSSSLRTPTPRLPPHGPAREAPPVLQESASRSSRKSPHSRSPCPTNTAPPGAAPSLPASPPTKPQQPAPRPISPRP